MIATCTFIGRCGNQLFQIAATLAYAMRHNKKVGFPTKTALPKEWPLYFDKLPRYRQGSPKSWKQPDDGKYYDIPVFPGDIKLHGFFQSEKYFAHDDSFRNKLYSLIDYQVQTLNDGCAIHVRRGDYLIHKDSFPTLPLTYYQKAIEKMKAIGVKTFTVFSDDPDWCEQYFSGSIVRGQTPVQDMFAMSRFKYIITANSSFSWWGAWLGEEAGKTVMVPHHNQYYGPSNPCITEDLFPERWIELKF